jgi:two-component system, OmpR family, sensor histidine kinase SenX3
MRPPYAGGVDLPVAASVAAALLGLLVGSGSVLAFRISEREQRGPVNPVPEPALPRGVGDVLAVLPSAAVVLDGEDAVVRASPAAYAFGVVRAADVVHASLLHLVRQVRRDGVIREAELELPRGLLGEGVLVVHARVAPLGPLHVLLLVEDRTEARRLEEIRRDFLANVSHELKTPVGAISLLSETVKDAADDPEAVRRFAGRLEQESARLSALVQEIIDLSRLQVAKGLDQPEVVELDHVVAEAVDRSRLVADAGGTALEIGPASGARVYGDRSLLVTAVRNLVDNAVRYSDAGTRVRVEATLSSGGNIVEIAVEDQGIGIADADQARVFERFYRVDPARSRRTGGTGLGLSIVKHVAANHGGDVTVRSSPGQGSTFTLRLPSAVPPGNAVPVVPAAHPAPRARSRSA